MIAKTLFGVVRKSTDDGHEFVLQDDLRLFRSAAEDEARLIKRSRELYDKANPVVRIAEFALHEVPA